MRVPLEGASPTDLTPHLESPRGGLLTRDHIRDSLVPSAPAGRSTLKRIDLERPMAIEARARAAYVPGATERSRSTLGRPLTQHELEAVLARFPRQP